MATSFPLLGDAQYITYLQPLVHRGSNPTAHLAEIRYPVQSAPIVSVVKLMDPSGVAACNEAIAWLFLRAAGLQSPSSAALITLSEQKLVKVMGRKAQDSALVSNGAILAWASKHLQSESIRVMFAGAKADERLVSHLRTVAGAAVAAFDEVFLNTDRNTGNLLFTDPQTCVPIDHERLFGDQDWCKGPLVQLQIESDALRRLRHAQAAGVISQADYEETLNRMVHFAEKHASVLEECSGQIAELLARVYPYEGKQLAARVLSFLVERTAQHWIKDRLGVV